MSTAEIREQRWSPWSAPLALLLAITLALLVGTVVFVVSDIVAGEGDTPGAKIVATALGDLCFIAGAVILARVSGRTAPEQFGLRPPARPWAALGLAIAAYVGFIVFAALWLNLVGETTKDDKTLDNLGVDQSTLALVASLAVVCVLAPIAEEFLFRGFIFTALRNWAGPWGAAAMTGLLFGAIHLDPDRPISFLVPLAFLGFLLCLVYWRTGSLYPCIALHAANNAIAFGATEDWTWWQIPLGVVAALCAVAAILAAVRRVDRRAFA